VSGPVFSAIAGDTLRALNVPPNMPIKQLVVSDDSPATAPSTGAQKLAAGGKAKHMIVSSTTRNSPGVVR
jgi:cell division protein FtsI (penicillin-binding protein 3)